MTYANRCSETSRFIADWDGKKVRNWETTPYVHVATEWDSEGDNERDSEREPDLG